MEYEGDEERRQARASERIRLVRDLRHPDPSSSDDGSSSERLQIIRDAETRARDEASRAPGPELPFLGALLRWETEQRPIETRVRDAWARWGRPLRNVVVMGATLLLAVQVAARPDPTGVLADLRDRLRSMEERLQARHGELELVRLEMARLNAVVERSERYGIPADLAAAIHDIADAEGIEPELAFRLVQIESEFYPRAISSKGAVGLAQLMPSTAYGMDPTLEYEDLFDRETNLRLGFRYLRRMLDKYDGNLRLALLAYNRGPGRVDSLRRSGRDPANGYARAILKGQ